MGVSHPHSYMMHTDDSAVLGEPSSSGNRLDADDQDRWCTQLHTALCHSNRL